MTKQDKDFVESPGHPDLSDGLPLTTKASFANKPHSTGRQGAESVRHDSTDCNEETSQGRGQKKNINSNHKKNECLRMNVPNCSSQKNEIVYRVTCIC